MDWQTRRRLLYALVTLISISAVVIFLLRDTVFPPPTCFDNKKNGYEGGVDCGGACSLMCTEDVSPLTVIWSKAIKVSENTYDIVGMISNKNIDNASLATGYTFSVYDSDGRPMGNIKGTTTVPVDGDLPVIKQSVPISRAPAQVVMTLEDTPHYKVKEKPTSPTIRVSNERYENIDNVSRVYAKISNTKRISISDLPIRVILFDENSNAYAVGETIIPILDKEESKVISITWTNPLPHPPTRIKIYPIFDPFVGIE